MTFDTEGVRIHDSVAPVEGEPVFRKSFPNSFHQTPLLEHSRQQGVTPLAIAGMMTHMCADATVRAAFEFGLECLLANDACATRSLSLGGVRIPASDLHTSFLASLNGLFGRVQPARELCASV